MQTVVALGKLLAATVLLSVLLQQCACEGDVDIKKKELSPGEVRHETADLSVTPPVYDKALSAVGPVARTGERALSEDDDDSDSIEDESESRQHGIKIKKKKKKPKLKKSKKALKKLLPLLMIPLLIQAKLIPLFIFKLKLLALKAFGIGKLALILIVINIIYTAMHGAKNMDHDQHYSKEVLANEHYGYNGGPEIGAWINRRHYDQTS